MGRCVYWVVVGLLFCRSVAVPTGLTPPVKKIMTRIVHERREVACVSGGYREAAEPECGELAGAKAKIRRRGAKIEISFRGQGSQGGTESAAQP